MNTYHLRLAVALAIALFPGVAMAQHEGHQAADGQASPDVAQCARVQPVVDNIIAAADGPPGNGATIQQPNRAACGRGPVRERPAGHPWTTGAVCGGFCGDRIGRCSFNAGHATHSGCWRTAGGTHGSFENADGRSASDDTRSGHRYEARDARSSHGSFEDADG